MKDLEEMRNKAEAVEKKRTDEEEKRRVEVESVDAVLKRMTEAEVRKEENEEEMRMNIMSNTEWILDTAEECKRLMEDFEVSWYYKVLQSDKYKMKMREKRRMGTKYK